MAPTRDEDRHLCLTCGAPFESDDRFCRACGASRAAEAAAAPYAPPAPVVPGDNPARGLAKRSRWPILAVVGAFAVAGGAVAIWAISRESSPPAAIEQTTTSGPTTASEITTPSSIDVKRSYDESIHRSTSRLAASAAVLGRALSEVARPTQIPRIRRIALVRVPSVQSERVKLAKDVPADLALSQQRKIVNAAGLHRRYLLMIVRISRLPAAAALKRLPVLQRLAQSSLRAYGAYFAAVQRPNLVANTGYADLSGLRDALRLEAKRDRRARAKAAKRRSPTPAAPARGVPTIYQGAFGSVDGRQQCFTDGSYAACASIVSGQTASMRAGGGSSYDGYSSGGNQSASRMPEGTSFTTPNGLISCESGSFGIHCSDNTQVGYGFFIGDRYVRIFNAGQEARF